MAGRTVAWRQAAAEGDVLRQCRPDLPVEELQHRVLGALRRHVSVDAAFFATADPATLLMTGAVSEEPLVAAGAQFLAAEYGTPDVNLFRELAVAGRTVATLDGATHARRPDSARWREVMAPLGLGDELRAVLRTGPDTWGFLCLHRADAAAGFSAREAALVARVAPHVAAALRTALLAARQPAGAPAPGVVLLTDTLEPLGATPSAEQLLSLLPTAPATRSRLPVAVQAVAAAVLAAERGGVPPDGPPRARVRSAAGGWVTVSASRLHDAEDAPGAVAVVLEPASPADTTPLLLAAAGLTGREAEVAQLVLRGASTRAIGAALHLSEYTVQDHLKAVFDKVGVRSRGELAATLAGRASSGR